MRSFSNRLFKYLRGFLRKARASIMHTEPRVNDRVNLLGEMKIIGSMVNARKKKKPPANRKIVK